MSVLAFFVFSKTEKLTQNQAWHNLRQKLGQLN